VLKVELHSHSADDPVDAIPHSTAQLIDRAAALGYQALAITLHDRQLDVREYGSFAAERGVTLIPGIERTIQGKHVLLLNFSRASEDVRTFDDLAALKRREAGLVIAPHPFFPGSTCVRGAIDRYRHVFDAVEYNGMFTSTLNFNVDAVRWAHIHGKPMVGCGDIHRLRQLGSTYSLVDAEPDAGAICAAILAGRVQVQATPRSWASAIGIMADLTIAEVLPAGFWQEAPVAAPLTVARRSPR
jgi:predicted metal-dependent phosphoesterase TrpH